MSRITQLICALIGHKYVFQGGMKCPKDTTEDKCSMSVHWCTQCKRYVYDSYDDCLCCKIGHRWKGEINGF